ncbi:Uncharacterized protein TCM_007045 [Theobroma cacao]|uniref:Aminotransferase-like plant mobile domain-containing protein n=1 Tax=Theobroma cacao TaxID=3641 RepID=A0A061DZX0_THECC|nr:Uncharacterized protein TCM_007045 [Theobroma cacao]
MLKMRLTPKIHYDKIIREQGEDRFGEEIRAKQVDEHPSEPVGYDWNRLCSEAPPYKRIGIPGQYILKFRFERGEFSLYAIKLGSNYEFVHGWNDWVIKVLKNPSYVKLLSSAGILDVIRVISKLNICREKRMNVWRAILARWSTFFHTMIAAWGEFTFTLEDVCVLLELPCIGKHDFHSIKLFEEKVGIRDFFLDLLKSLIKTSKVAQFSNWIGIFYKKFNAKGIEIGSLEYLDHKHELMALIIFWLARHILPGCLDDGISPAIVPLAIKIVKGMHFPLAPLYLGSLYKKLDLYQLKTVESAGNNYRASARHDQLSRGNVLEMMDVTKEFNPIPYVQPINGFSDPEIYYDRHPLQFGRMSSYGINFYVWVHSSQLPSMIESSSSGGDRNILSVERETTAKVELNSVEEEETFEAKTKEESYDSEHSNEFDDESVDVDEAEVEVVPEATPNVEVIHDVGVDIDSVGVDIDNVGAIPNNPRAFSSPVPDHRDASSASGTQVAHTEQSDKKVDFHGFQVSLE